VTALRPFLAAVLIALPAAAGAEPADFSALDALLHRHVRPGVREGIALNLVDYAAWARDPDHQRAVDALATFDPARLETRPERLAFWVNAYNLLAIRVVIENGVTGSGSIKDAGNLFFPVWKRDAGSVGGRAVSLDEVEHRILRPMGEPRVHFAIVCASLSCPDLRPEAYVPARLDAQLDDQVKGFLANPAKGMVGDEAVRVSRIFDWFEADFGGAAGVVRFLRAHTPGRAPPVARVAGHLPYDWSLNGGSAGPREAPG
jgi:hypothetical protein